MKVTAPTPSGDTSRPPPSASSPPVPRQDTSGSRQQAADLIDSTQRGVNSLRNLNGDQNKTVAQIRSFLDQAAARSAQRRRRRRPHPRHQSQDAPRRTHRRRLSKLLAVLASDATRIQNSTIAADAGPNHRFSQDQLGQLAAVLPLSPLQLLPQHIEEPIRPQPHQLHRVLGAQAAQVVTHQHLDRLLPIHRQDMSGPARPPRSD